MKITFLGHSSFLLTTEDGTRILTDPFDLSAYPGAMTYSPITQSAEVVTVSHGHGDHQATHLVGGDPVIIRGNGKFVAAGVEFLGVAAYHDENEGAERGENTIFILRADGLSVAHFGDLGHVLSSDQAAEVGRVDVALIPIGGFFTIDAQQAWKVAQQVDARIIIPMHYSNKKCNFPIAGVEVFLADKPKVVRQGEPTVEISPHNMPAEQTVIVLEPAL
ncbi:MAG: MBL fold metallo-hydrolase [Armatimonadetes bacterium]|jgi:L-ascorbate metabolism protein UlaG (beta-lactamase superfamily)|nr:MBL fold metallo-hydrolase [Armatimonadota bacterium]